MLKLSVTASTDYSINSLKFDVALVAKDVEINIPVFFDCDKANCSAENMNKWRDQAITRAIVAADLQEDKFFTHFTQNSVEAASEDKPAKEEKKEEPKKETKAKAKKEEPKKEVEEDDPFSDEEEEKIEMFDKTNSEHKKVLLESIAKVAGNDWPKHAENKAKSRALAAEMDSAKTPFLRDGKLSKEVASLIKKHFK